MTGAIDEPSNTREELSTDEAAQRAGLSRNQITNLLRQEKLEGRNFGGRYWIVYADSLERYLASPRKTGPRGPRTSPQKENTRSRAAPADTAVKKKTS